MRRLLCAFVVCIWHKQVFSWCGSLISTLFLKEGSLLYIATSHLSLLNCRVKDLMCSSVITNLVKFFAPFWKNGCFKETNLMFCESDMNASWSLTNGSHNMSKGNFNSSMNCCHGTTDNNYSNHILDDKLPYYLLHGMQSTAVLPFLLAIWVILLLCLISKQNPQNCKPVYFHANTVNFSSDKIFITIKTLKIRHPKKWP